MITCDITSFEGNNNIDGIVVFVDLELKDDIFVNLELDDSVFNRPGTRGRCFSRPGRHNRAA